MSSHFSHFSALAYELLRAHLQDWISVLFFFLLHPRMIITCTHRIMFTRQPTSRAEKKKFHICAQSFAWLISTNELKIKPTWNVWKHTRPESAEEEKKSLQNSLLVFFFFGENVLVREKNFPNIVESCRLTQINWIVNTEERCERNNKADDFNALKQILTISSDDFLFRSCMHSSSSQFREKKRKRPRAYQFQS